MSDNILQTEESMLGLKLWTRRQNTIEYLSTTTNPVQLSLYNLLGHLLHSEIIEPYKKGVVEHNSMRGLVVARIIEEDRVNSVKLIIK